jgi:hypothetical protein
MMPGIVVVVVLMFYFVEGGRVKTTTNGKT